jgi:RND family efflux transporter MFP subunit
MSKDKNKDLKEVKENEAQGSKLDDIKPVEPGDVTIRDLGEIKETTGDQVEIYDEDDNVDLTDTPVKKKRFKKRYLVIGAAVLVIGAFVVARLNSAKSSIVMVETQEVALGNIENILSVSGTVESAESKSYFSEVTAPVDKIEVKVGDKVKKGDILCTYDQEALDLAQKSAELSITQAKGSYNAMYSGTAAADRKYAQGMNAQQINDRLDAITEEIDAINYKIQEKTNRLNQTITDLQKTLRDINQNGIDDSMEGLFSNGSTDYIYRNESGNREDGEYTEPTEHDRQMSLAVQQSLVDVQHALNTDEELQAWRRQITDLQQEQAHLQSAKASQINGGTAQASKAQLEATELSQGDVLAKIEEAREGIRSDFNGVITAIPANVVEGATLTNGAAIMTVANLDTVQVAIQVSKSDLPKVSVGEKVDITINGKSYSGEITKISGTATKNANGVAVVDAIIKITNPDSDIILGVEANNKIHAQKADDTIVLPYELIQTDSTGDYVYVLENGLVTRKDVTIGISNSTDAQITEGLSVGEKVISSDVSILTEGMPVVEQQ